MFNVLLLGGFDVFSCFKDIKISGWSRVIMEVLCSFEKSAGTERKSLLAATTRLDRVEVVLLKLLVGFAELINASRDVTSGSNFSLMNHQAPTTNFGAPASQFSLLLIPLVVANLIARDKPNCNVYLQSCLSSFRLEHLIISSIFIIVLISLLLSW